MRYIKKTLPVPSFFVDDTNFLHNDDWEKFSGDKKRRLKSYILKKEQDYLCCYCEKSIDLDMSHVEHIKPKSNFKSETYKYSNLIVSCQGDHCNTNGSKTQQICGHKKDNDYCANKFLDPTLYTDISSFFIFEDNGKILSSGKDNLKANFTINLLNLNGNNDSLALAREKVLDALIERALEEGLDPSEFHDTLGKVNEYATFLQYIFK